MLLNGGLSIDRSYYLATATPAPERPALVGPVEADLCVVGGGCTGLSAALHAAERGLRVVLVEAGRIGWGASGRNGGQVIPGLRIGAADLVQKFGTERGRALFNISVEGVDLMRDLVARYAIDCDFKTTGHLSVAVKASALRHYDEELSVLDRVMGYRDAAFIDRAGLAAHIASDDYLGGLLDRRGGHVHPLNFTIGLARATESAGVTLFERSPVTRVSEAAGRGGVTVETAQGRVTARRAVIACDALLGELVPRLAARIMPIANYIVTTEPLNDGGALIPSDVAISDSRFVVNYFRLTADGRLLFGGGERYTPNPPANIPDFVRPHIERVFPQVRGRRLDYGWGGMVSVTTTRLPHIGRTGEIFYAHGYSGLGVVMSSFSGKLLAEAMSGAADRFDLFARIAPPAFPGGARFRHPLYVLGMLWYAMRDRL